MFVFSFQSEVVEAGLCLKAVLHWIVGWRDSCRFTEKILWIHTERLEMTGGVDKVLFLLILHSYDVQQSCTGELPPVAVVTKTGSQMGKGWLGGWVNLALWGYRYSWSSSCLLLHIDTFSLVLGWPFRKNPANLCQRRELRRGRQWGEGESGHLLTEIPLPLTIIFDLPLSKPVRKRKALYKTEAAWFCVYWYDLYLRILATHP